MVWRAETRGILAGRGIYPTLLARRLVAHGIRVVVAGIDGQFNADLSGVVSDVGEFPLGDLERPARFFRERGAQSIYLAGGVRRRWSWLSLRPDLKTLLLLPKALIVGDNSLLTSVADRFFELGVRVCDPSPLLENLFATPGLIAGPTPNESIRWDMNFAREAAMRLGRNDKGQAVLVKDGVVIGLESTSGTDALLCQKAVSGSVLVKMVKQGQDRRFDMPVIGPSTIMLARSKKIAAIGVEERGVILLDKPRVLHQAASCGMTLFGLRRSDMLAKP